MKRFSDFIKTPLMESLTVYRGIPSAGRDKDRMITWVSTSRQHAIMYAEPFGGKGEVIEYKITKTLVPLDLQFVYSEVDVGYEEIRVRLNDAILEQFEHGRLTQTKTEELLDALRALKTKFSGMLQVNEWMHKPQIVEIIKKAGFNCILQREGMRPRVGDIITYGILDKSLLS
jgi:hypothetical protein